MCVCVCLNVCVGVCVHVFVASVCAPFTVSAMHEVPVSRNDASDGTCRQSYQKLAVAVRVAVAVVAAVPCVPCVSLEQLQLSRPRVRFEWVQSSQRQLSRLVEYGSVGREEILRYLQSGRLIG